MTTNPLKSEYGRAGGPQLATLASLAETWVVGSIDGIGSRASFDPGAMQVLVFSQKIWARDDADTTSADDGVSVIVCSGKRFKASGAPTGPSAAIWPVATFQATPPTTAAAGDTYGIAASPSGVWAGHGNNIAVCLVGGTGASIIWGYVTPVAGMISFHRGLGIFRTYNTSATWVDGLPASYGSKTIAPEALSVGRYSVASYGNTPPGSPVDGNYYLIGTTPTGAWAGYAGAIAKRVSASWSFLTSFVGGEKAYDISTGTEYTYRSGAWTTAGSAHVVAWPARITRTSAVAAAGSAATDFITAPTGTKATILPETSGQTNYALSSATNRLIVRLSIDCSTGGTVALLIDGELTPATGHWKNIGTGSSFIEFEVAAGDTSTHLYTIAGYALAVARCELQFVEVTAA